MLRHSRSRPALALLGAGVFLLVLAPMLAWYVEPRAKRTPTDVNMTTVLTGRGSYFDTDSVTTVEDQEITVTRRVLGDVADSERSGRAVWDVSTTIDTPRTLSLGDPRRSLKWTTERWVTDRRTNLPVHCCEETPAFDGDAYLKFPFDVRKRTHRWWDSTLGGAVPLRFAGTRDVFGHRGYRFTGTVRPVRTGTRQVPGRLVDRPGQGQVLAEEWYANDRIELVVDPRTGRLLDVSLAPRMTLRAPGGERDEAVLLRSDRLRFSEATRRQAVRLAESDNRRLRMLGETAPAGAALAGTLLAVAALPVGRRAKRHTARDGAGRGL
ncbi:DUF3068 domain-containing protein [Streptomyces sp. SS8]